MRKACKRLLLGFAMFAVLLTAASGIGPSAALAAGEVELFTPYTDLSAPPGESLSYSVEVLNRDSVTHKVDLNFQTGGNQWEYELMAGGHAIRQVSVKPGESQTVNLTLHVPLEIEKGEYSFQLVAQGLTTLPLKVDVSERGTFTTEFEAEQANIQGHADSKFTFSTTLRNRTADEQTYSLSASPEAGWDVRFMSGGNSVTSIAVQPNASQTISVEVTPPPQVQAGTYQIPIAAANNATSAETTLEAVITGTYALTLTTPDERLNAEVTAGAERRVDLVVRNDGTADLEDVTLSAQSPVNWEVSFEPKTITGIKPGESASVQATIKAADKALAGDYVVNMTASASQKSADATFRVAVKSSVLWGWIGVLIIIAVAAGVYYLFRKYGRR